jgi:endonuclease/exonuclease/phosphatase family metal-dependent hydrolase
VGTFNVLCSFCAKPGLDAWQTRLPQIDAALERMQADLLGLQELFTEEEVDHFLERFPEYDAFYYVDPGTEGAPLSAYPDAAIFYRRDRFRLVRAGVYWLSPTPDEPWSAGFANGQIWRLLVWTELEQTSDGRHLLFASTHFDNNSPSQEKSAPLVVERSGPGAWSIPIVLVGDFNSDPSSTAYQTLAGAFEEAYDASTEHKVLHTEDPPPEWHAAERIDHVFLSPGDFQVRDDTVDLSRYGDPPRFFSDHWPVAATLRWPERP